MPKLNFNGVKTNLTEMTYEGTITPLLKSISPRYGNVVGGEEITFSGTGFSTNTDDISIVMDGVTCVVTAATAQEIKCKSGERRGLHSSTLVIKVKDKGYVSLQGLVFTYANYWSAEKTWGLEFAPMDGESIHIPTGLNLVVDIDETPEINAVIVEGSLIFAPHPTNKKHHRKFNAHFIMV